MSNIFEYTIVQWMLFFYIYCFLGWCVESSIVSYRQKRWVNRGYLTLPMLPIYGSGAIVVLFVSLPVRNSIILVYLFGMIAATALEYITGWMMESILKVKYWDYTGKFGNIKGRICLESSLFWGVLSIFMTYVIHDPIEKFVLSLSAFTLEFVVTIISVMFLADFIISTKKAIDFRNMLEYLSKTREKIEDLYMELEEKGKILTESIGDRIEESIENQRVRIEESIQNQRVKIEESIENRRARIEESIENQRMKIEESIENQKIKNDAITEEIMKKISLLYKEREEVMDKMVKFYSILKANPTVTSKRFHRTLKDIRERMKQR
ncbi:MAG: hypothetical protein ACI4F9_00585 [Lachnospiraceae bacterium]